ncbi:MAG: hypothetical protein K0Q70_2717, partial [Rhodospirillales bacterium]|nr:hypothetical protein [Rhodospirillales bacterium]
RRAVLMGETKQQQAFVGVEQQQPRRGAQTK